MRLSVFFRIQVCDTTLQIQAAKVCKGELCFHTHHPGALSPDGFLQTPVWSAILLWEDVFVCMWPLVLEPGFASF